MTTQSQTKEMISKLYGSCQHSFKYSQEWIVLSLQATVVQVIYKRAAAMALE
jgi:hypothetical protein